MKQSYDERNRDLLIWIDGKLEHRDRAGVSPFDSSVQGGDAVWEGLRLYQGRIFRLEQHLERLEHSAKALAFSEIPPRERILDALRETLEANRMYDGVHVRLTLTRGRKYTSGMDPRLNTAGPTLIVLAEFKAPVYDKGGLRLASSSVRRFGVDQLDPRIHHNNLLPSILAKIEANAAGADDALMLDQRGFIAETNATHLFGVVDGVLVTSHTVACPEGVTRAVVLELAREAGIAHAVRDWAQAELYRASEAFCTGTMGELAPVVEVDGRPIGDGRPGPLTARLSSLFAERVAVEGTPLVAQPE